MKSRCRDGHSTTLPTRGQLLENPEPIQPNFSSIQGQYVKLQLLSVDALSQLQKQQIWHVVQTEPNTHCWAYLPYSGFARSEELMDFLDGNFHFDDAIHFGIETHQGVVGWVGLLNVRKAHHVIEIGNVYFSHQLKQSRAATEVIYLLLKHCFAQGFRRVEWKCDALNEPSRRAALRFGFQYEGTFRQDRIVKGRNRDTAWFSVIDTEWPAIRQGYKLWLARSNFDADGQQIQALSVPASKLDPV